MPRWAHPKPLDEIQVQVGDSVWIGMDMKSPDPAQMKQGTYREGYNCRLEAGGLITRKGSIYPGSFNYVQYNRMFGDGLYSDPNGLEWIVVAVSSGVWFTRDGEAPRFIPMATQINYPIEFVQAFDKLFMFRGPDLSPLLWNGDWSIYWQTFPPPTGSRQTIPNADTAEFVANRLLVPYGKDRVGVSDIGDYVEYDWILNDFQVNTGQADSLVRIFPWIKNIVIMFKEHSIFSVSNVVGDLTQTSLDQISNNLGLVGRKAVVQCGNDIFFMDYSGVYQISQIFENSPQVQALPISDAIKPVIDAINWNAASLIRANVRRERLYFAIPLKNAIRNNALIVYNLIAQSWESIDTFDDPDFRIDDLIKANYNNERRLFALDRARGLIILLEQGKTDILGNSTAFEYQVKMDVLTRGYLGAGQRSNFARLEIDTATWNANFSVESFVDGTNAKLLAAQVTGSRTKYQVWGKKPWLTLNTNDDHANAYREDYSVMLPLMLGEHGVQLEREQEKTNRFKVKQFGRYCQLRIKNKTGFLGLRTIVFEGFEDQRQERSQI